MTEIFQELVKETISKIERLENRSRSRSAKAQISFNHAVETTLIDLWKATHCIPIRECAINKRAGYYSENPRYRDPLLTYNQSIAAFDGLRSLGYIEVTKEGYFDRTTLQGSLTKFVARDELLERLQEIEDLPAFAIKPDFDRETIILRDVVDGQRKAIEYDDTPKTEEYRRNLNF